MTVERTREADFIHTMSEQSRISQKH